MKSEIKKLPKSEVELTCIVEPHEFAPFVENAIKTIGEGVEIPGFRRGKAPKSMILDRVGIMHIYEEAARDAISHFYAQCANQHQVDPLGTPQVTLHKLAPDNPLEFTIRVAVLPEIELPDYSELLKPLAKERRTVTVTEAMIEDSLVWLQKSRATRVSRIGASQQTDHVIVDFSMTHNGVAIEQGEQKDFMVRLGQHQAVSGFEERLIGVSKGENLEFDLPVTADYWNKTIAGKTIHFSVTVKDIQQEVLPEANDAFAESLGNFKTTADLRHSIKEGLELEEREKERQRFRVRILKEIDSHTICEPPEVLVVSELDTSIKNIKNSIESTGIAWEEYLKQIGKTEDGLRQEFLPQAQERIRFALIINAIAKKEKVEVSDEEVQAEVDKYLIKYRSLVQAEKDIDPKTLIAQTRDILKNEKVSRHLESLADKGDIK
ncbi:MAG: Trigger factor [Parcubacteria group bacterium GW2011_GWA1_45_7]|nr:MAG: Trigger factor [Parcubacteria group bacterium GW2011_GWA1_45_7]